MPDNVDGLLESIIRITEERDKQSLERVLIETLADFIEHEAIILLRVRQGENALEESLSFPENACRNLLTIQTSQYGDQYVQPDNSILHCIHHAAISHGKANDASRAIYPLINNHKVTGVLLIYGKMLSENNDSMIRGFIRIYSNFANILSDSEHDTLTGLLNRKTFDSRITQLIAHTKSDMTFSAQSDRRGSNADKSHWLGILDIDHFKKINDTYGHIYGDEVLLLFSVLMKKVFRNRDLLFRYGGEEFIVVLSPASEPDAYRVFERFRQQLATYCFPQVGHVTTSIGMVRINALEHPRIVIEHADKALYYAKEHGRNRTCNYHQLIANGELQARQNENDIELF